MSPCKFNTVRKIAASYRGAHALVEFILHTYVLVFLKYILIIKSLDNYIYFKLLIWISINFVLKISLIYYIQFFKFHSKLKTIEGALHFNIGKITKNRRLKPRLP